MKITTLKQAIYKIEQEFYKKEQDLKYRTYKKYEQKASVEFEKKKKQLDKKMEIALHNAKVRFSEDKRLKIRIPKKRNTSYADACRLAQLIAKLKRTNEKGQGNCICCDPKLYDWDLLDGGHRIPKGKSRATALDLRNIHTQRKYCNSKFGGNGNQHLQKIDEREGKGTKALLLEKKASMTGIKPIDFIREYVDYCLQLLETKTFDVAQYKKFCLILKKKYNIL